MLLPRQPPLWRFVALSIPSMLGLVASSSHHHDHRQFHDLHHVPDMTSNAALAESSPQDLSPRFLQAHLDFKNLASEPSGSAGQDDFTCGPDKPCSNGACCGESGWCGYGPTYCGDGCQSHCDAVADCGQYAKDPDAGCPLNVCCSQFGFCGTTSDFCGQGCQSNCEQPKPSGSPSNVQERIIGYWEAWNSQHPCGTMNVGEIPVSYLTHLNVAFGYISQDFKVTNMDGVSPDLYRNVGNLKARNPSLKIVISLGGWAFSDPGPWRTVFPTLVSSSSNRAIFIQNLLGFLSEYGYDGVDLDWEYPGAQDRGGSNADAANYIALLKELRDAISSSGADYIVTFTAPTSYWYLRHFDIKGMAAYVDWINLMSYDLHGVWDSDDPIGSQVLSHTNLTEIDLALDLFWRAEVEPSSIVVGLAFYGRTFHLKDSSCWKPGCPFEGPGDAGECTGTSGILSYREIQSIIEQTGATSYLDKDAAVRYLVYGQNSWVSYDDEITFRAKIDYANSLGLSGLMVWAIDLDDSRLDALRAISNANAPVKSGDVESIFSLVDLENLFPLEDLPSSDTEPSYGLIPFGSSGDLADPSPGSGPFGFLLIAGDSHAVTSLKKRDDEPEPFVFLDCPPAVQDQPRDKTQKARVTCLSDDVKGCFRILERGVEGTVVEMPHNCAANSFARAISLELSADQSLPQSMRDKTSTSPVFDFSFDFNLGLMRRDTNNTSIRIDYSNVQGYWDQIVNAPGIQSRDSNNVKSRFFAPTTDDWNSVFASKRLQGSSEDSTKIKKNLNATVFWDTAKACPLDDGESVDQGFGAFVTGSLDIEFWFGLSLIATLKDGKFFIDQAHGFLKAKGQTDLTYTIAGIGDIDISKANKGNPAFSADSSVDLEGHTVVTSDSLGKLSINPYWKLQYQFATVNGSDGSDLTSSKVSFSGRMNAHIVTDLGDFEASFPTSGNPEEGMYNDERQKNKISIPSDDVLYATSPGGGQIAIGTVLTFGLKMQFLDISEAFAWNNEMPELGLVYNTMGFFTFSHGNPDQTGVVCPEYEVITNVYQTANNTGVLGWLDLVNHTEAGLVYDRQQPSAGKRCYPDMVGEVTKNSNSLSRIEDLPGRASDETNDSTHKRSSSLASNKDILNLKKRGFGSIDDGWYPLPLGEVTVNPNTFKAADGPPIGQGSRILPSVAVGGSLCFQCASLSETETKKKGGCCGCISLDWVYGYSDIECDDTCDPIYVDGPWTHFQNIRPRNQDSSKSGDSRLEKRVTDASGTASVIAKKVTVCGVSVPSVEVCDYPAFPSVETWPWERIDRGKWDPISRYWGNISADCTDWTVGALDEADTEDTDVGKLRVQYQTEHVFEGQLIGAFFSSWLNRGLLYPKSRPFTQAKMDCAIPKTYMMDKDEFPVADGEGGSMKIPFLQALLCELGNQSRLDRLAILLGRVNLRKGGLFSGTAGVAISTFKRMSAETQILVAKELGMIFTYLNHEDIWPMFCATYEGLYDQMGKFNAWYADNGQTVTIPDLKAEWKIYIRTVLDQAAIRARTTFDSMYEEGTKGRQLEDPILEMWKKNKKNNRPLIQLSGTCDNLGAPE